MVDARRHGQRPVRARRSASRSRRRRRRRSGASNARRCLASRGMEAATAPQTPFSLELTQDQRDIRDWVHGFAESVVRPAAAEWDEREETPWPIIQEAAKIGLYGFEGLAQFCADETGLMLPIVNEELFWGDAGIGMAIMGTTLAVAGDLRHRHAASSSASGCPQCYGTEAEPEGRRVLRLRARRRLRRVVAAHPREVRRGQGRVGPQRPEGVGDQRRHRQRPRGRRLGRPRAGLARPGGVRRSRRARPASRWARRSRSTACAPRTPPTSSSTTAASPARCLLGGKEKLDERLARAREGTRVTQPGGDADVRGHAARPSARRRSASPAPPTSTRSTTPRSASSSARPIIENQAIAFALADMKMEIDAARLLVWRAVVDGPPRASRSPPPRAR